MTMRVRIQSSREEGQVLILFALMSFVLVGCLALAFDVGYLLTERRKAQAAVDAASLAGAEALLHGASEAEVRQDVNDYLSLNGIDVAESDVSVEVVSRGSDGEVRVAISHPVQRFFLGAVYTGDWKASAAATSIVTDGAPKQYALLALDESGDSINLTGNVGIDVIGGGAMSNGGFRCTGNGTFHAELTADAHSGFYEVGNCQIIGEQGKNPSAPVVSDPLAHVPPPPKPAKPATPALGDGSCSPSNSESGNGKVIVCPSGAYDDDIQTTGNSNTIRLTGSAYLFRNNVDVKLVGNNPTIEFGSGGSNNVFYFDGGSFQATGNNPKATFWPGTYYFGRGGDFVLTGNNPTIEFKPGKYLFYMEDGDFKFTGNNLSIYPDGSDMQLYFDGGEFVATGNTPNTTIPPGVYYFDGGGVTITGNSKVYGNDVLFFFNDGGDWKITGNAGFEMTGANSALYPGMHPGMLFYSARGNDTVYSITGNSDTLFTGVIYLPDADLQLTGNADGVWANGQVIVNTFTTTGNTNVDIRYADYVDIRVPAVYLAE